MSAAKAPGAAGAVVKPPGAAGAAVKSPDCFVAVFADESCIGNGREGDNPGGAGALIELRHPSNGTIVRRDLWISERASTNNRMALRSVIEAMDALGAKGARCRVTFTTDSRYIVDGMTQWVHSWARNGWKRKGGAIENLELWHDAIGAAHLQRALAPLREVTHERAPVVAWIAHRATGPSIAARASRRTRPRPRLRLRFAS